MTRKPPHAKLQTPAPGSARWTEGFWADRFKLAIDTIIPSMDKAMHTPGNAAVFSNLYIAAGLEEGTHTGTNWSDGDCYKWMEAVAHLYAITRDPELDRTLDELIAVVAKAQDDDGYISTQTQLDPGKDRWGRRNFHELYNMGHLLTAASVHHRVTGKDNFLAVARKLADYLYATFAPRPPELAGFGWNPSNIMGLIDLYRETGDARYRELADIFVTMRGSKKMPLYKTPDDDTDFGDQNQNRVPLREEDQAVGHVVTATYLYCGAADVYAETGDKTLLDALLRIWDDAFGRKTYITGGSASQHFGVSIRRDLVHEAYDRPYVLPNASAYNETCATIGNAMWGWRMANITGDARFTGVMETVIYNGGLSPMSLDGTRFFYTNPLRWYGHDHLLLSQDAHERWFTYHCYCCPPQVARTIAGLYNWAYSLDENGIWAHIYGGNRLETALPGGGNITLRQTTNYPWDGDVTFTVETAPDHPIALRLRIPAWAEGATITVNDAPAGTIIEPETYAKVERTWSPGDRVRLSLPMDVRLIVAHPMVEEARNQVAVARGPIVYCLESTDLPEGVRISEIRLPVDAHLTPRFDAGTLGGVVVLEGDAERITFGTGDDQLYRTVTNVRKETVPITLIPYYAWNNRGEPEMSVWLPLA